MSVTDHCPHCGKRVPTLALGGLCPDCMFDVGMEPGTGEAGPDGTWVKASRGDMPEPAAIAAHFPQLEILECLGRGGMGVVYRARQPKLNRVVALKILAPERESDPRFAERFAREAQALARLNHPNIVTVHDFGEVGGLFYLLMEHVDGSSLRGLLRAGRLKPEQALGIVPRICEALQYAHERGIVHRDIKPENVLIDQEGRVKIADFGIARIVSEPGQSPPAFLIPAMDGASAKAANAAALDAGKCSPGSTEDRLVVGTPDYMAPEQVATPNLVDHRADIYSLGVVFYEMLTGELPVGRFQPPSVRARGVRLDGRLDGVVLRALEKEPERRYQRVVEVKTDVESIAASTIHTGAGSGVDGRNEVLGAAATVGPEETSWARMRRFPTGSRGLISPAVVGLARWTARGFSVALLAFYGLFTLAEGFPPIGTQPAGVQLNFVALGLMLAGFIVGWKREGTAALLIGCGWVVWHASEGRIDWNFFQTPLPVAALYAFCWWAARQRRTVALVATIGGFALALLGGMLFLPTSVHIRGLVTDASTGRPVRDARVELGNVGVPAESIPVLTSVRSDFRGLYALYVGWYRETMPLSVSAPGYVPRMTALGARPLGSRSLVRDVVLEPMGMRASAAGVPSEGVPGSVATAPPVVLRTVPVSGDSDVDASLVELSVTFSKPMLDGHWSWTTWSPETFPEMTGEPRYDADGRTCVLPVRLVAGRMYVIWLNSDKHNGFRDREGRPAVPYLLTFRTRD